MPKTTIATFMKPSTMEPHKEERAFTILVTDEQGETWDLNAQGEPIRSYDELIDFVWDIREQRIITPVQASKLQSRILSLYS